jgi:hypothetical protein
MIFELWLCGCVAVWLCVRVVSWGCVGGGARVGLVDLSSALESLK